MAAEQNDVPPRWDATQIPSMQGKRAIVTGGNSGIGYVTALELARKGAHVVIACRSKARGKEAEQKIMSELKTTEGAGKVEFMQLDVSSLSSVKSFSAAYHKSHDRLDLLINNAGIMAVPYAESADGIESQFATNHLGHFALTAQLLDLLKKSQPSRIVSVSSIAHRPAKMDLAQIVTPRDKYDAMEVYRNSKLYNLLFTFELGRRLQAKGIDGVTAVACHPGVSNTNLFQPMMENANWFVRGFFGFLSMLPIVQGADMGALPTLYAATAPKVRNGDYYGPLRFNGFRGYPTREEPVNVSKSEEHARALWKESERLAQIVYDM